MIESWNTTNCRPAKPFFDTKQLLAKMRALKAQFEQQPNLFVMTTSTLERLEQATKKACMGEPRAGVAIESPIKFPMTFGGVPIEDYPTVRECMDRIMQARDGERPQLVLSEDLPADCIDHPYIKRQVEQMASRFGF